MATVKFNLKNRSIKAETLIYLLFRYNGKRLKYSTGEKIEPKFWNDTKQRAKETRQFPQYPEFNAYLNKLENDVLTIYRKFVNDGIEPTPQQIREELNELLNRNQPKEEEEKITLFSFIEKFIEQAKEKRTLGTIKTYKTNFTHLKEYQKQSKKKLDFEDIDLDFYNEYLNYLFKKKNLSNNSVGKAIQVLKVFLIEATERGINSKMDFKSRKFKVLRESSESIYLTEVELNKLYHLNLTFTPRLEKIRDLFLVGCYTGLRFSDFTQITKANIQGNVIRINTQKTGAIVVIPLHPIVRAILKKYDNNLPSSISNQKMNDYLKELGELGELKTPIELTKSRGGLRIQTIQPKYELITTHTARRSFATNAFLNGVPTISIMKITGHKSERSFMKYIKITSEENANKLQVHPFFNKTPLRVAK